MLCSHQMATKVEEIGDCSMGTQKSLCLRKLPHLIDKT